MDRNTLPPLNLVVSTKSRISTPVTTTLCLPKETQRLCHRHDYSISNNVPSYPKNYMYKCPPLLTLVLSPKTVVADTNPTLAGPNSSLNIPSPSLPDNRMHNHLVYQTIEPCTRQVRNILSPPLQSDGCPSRRLRKVITDVAPIGDSEMKVQPKHADP